VRAFVDVIMESMAKAGLVASGGESRATDTLAPMSYG